DPVPASAAAEPERPRIVKPVEKASVDAKVSVDSTRPVQPRPPRPVAGPVDSPRPTPKVGESVQRKVQPEPEAEQAVRVAKAAPIEPLKPTAPAVHAQQRQRYLAALAASIDRRKYYPRVSRRRGEEGRVVVSFVIRKTGELTDLTVTVSSGSRRLDEAALKTLRRISPFQPIPEALARETWSITVPIAFHLSG
ncbi:MAG: TonB family protein, partial [Sedimenticolaceae bacterium]